MSNYGGSLFLYDKKFHFLSYKKNAPLRMRTRAKSRVLPDGNRARRECAPRRTLFFAPLRFFTFKANNFILTILCDIQYYQCRR